MPHTCTKIVVTLGPASERPEMIRKLITAGADVFRLNFSHGNREFHKNCIQTIRREAAAAGEPVAILQDLQGPRIRTGLLQSRPVELRTGQNTTLRHGSGTGSAEEIFVNYEHLTQDLRSGDIVLIADGAIELSVVKVEKTAVRCRITVGGLLGEHKGINLPGSRLSISSPTDKDIDDLHFGLDLGVDYVALSFVEKAADVLRLKAEMSRHIGKELCIPVIPKIERPVAIEKLEEILDVSDGVMVARGDLGIEMPPESVPATQKHIIRMANERALPVITATQMLESMISSPRPTRAEASDVANAILDGTDAVMLSGETSIGRYPAEAVTMMDRIAREIEALRPRQHTAPAFVEMVEKDRQRQSALASAACSIARELGSDAIAAFTITGSTARYLSQRRPEVPIFALTPNPKTFRLMSLFRGVRSVSLDVVRSTDEMFQQGTERLLERGLVSPGSSIVYIAGGASHTPGGSDMIKIQSIT